MDEDEKKTHVRLARSIVRLVKFASMEETPAPILAEEGRIFALSLGELLGGWTPEKVNSRLKDDRLAEQFSSMCQQRDRKDHNSETCAECRSRMEIVSAYRHLVRDGS